ncbi:MAG: aspartate/glutamate racemase family protein [Candidatus Daviesbacteria bacterium]|nr:aspartate/glutamate racemase family protein [Candidatus Daviesbacteria bacterium]
MNKNNKIIGILGGMGPQASAHLVKLLVDKSAKEFKAKNCEDFPEIILDSMPHPDFIASRQNSKIVVEMLKERIKNMEKMNVSVFALACNTAHIMLNLLKVASKTPFISMIDEVVKQVEGMEIKKIGLLASPTTFKSGLFQKGNWVGKESLSSHQRLNLIPWK